MWQSRVNGFQNIFLVAFTAFRLYKRYNLSSIDTNGNGCLPMIKVFGLRTIKSFVSSQDQLDFCKKYNSNILSHWFIVCSYICPFHVLYSWLLATSHSWTQQWNKVLKYLIVPLEKSDFKTRSISPFFPPLKFELSSLSIVLKYAFLQGNLFKAKLVQGINPLLNLGEGGRGVNLEPIKL